MTPEAGQIYFTSLNLLPGNIFSLFQALILIRIDFQYVHVLLNNLKQVIQPYKKFNYLVICLRPVALK